jgi:hypothetical protein
MWRIERDGGVGFLGSVTERTLKRRAEDRERDGGVGFLGPVTDRTLKRQAEDRKRWRCWIPSICH